MPKSTRTTNTMKISFAILGEIKVDDNVYCLNIDTTSKEVRADEVTAHAVAKVVENAITVRLEHFCMGVEARVAQLCHFLSQELDTVGGITKDDRLINLQLKVNSIVRSCLRNHWKRKKYLGKKGIQAMDLLALFDVSVVLGNTTESKLIHEVDLVRRFHVFFLQHNKIKKSATKGPFQRPYLEVFDNHWESSAEQHHLTISGKEGEQLLHDRSKLGGQ